MIVVFSFCGLCIFYVLRGAPQVQTRNCQLHLQMQIHVYTWVVLRFFGSLVLRFSSSSVLRLWRLFATPRVNGPDQMPLFPGKRFSCPCISQWIDDIMWTPLGLPLPLAICGTIHILQICWARFVGLAIGMRLWIYSAFGDIICLALLFDFFVLLLFFRVFFLWYYCYGIFCNSMWCGSHIWWAECSSWVTSQLICMGNWLEVPAVIIFFSANSWKNNVSIF